jgi:hypothetical protein
MEDENKQMIACNLGADFTAEHEWGIKDLHQTLGVSNDENVMGIERYRVRNPKMDQIVLIEENKNRAALICLKYQFDMKYLAERGVEKYGSELDFWPKDKELATAWDGGSFGIRVQRPVNIKRLKRLHEAIKNKSAAVWLGGGHVFQNAGLVVGIIDAIPANLKQQMHDAHVDTKKLYDASDATGIVKKIDAINNAHRDKHKDNTYTQYQEPCGYYALRPNWMMKTVLRGDPHQSTEVNSKYPVIYWLNPREQKKNDSGWYTVEELEQWIEGKGPVVEKKEKQVV